MPVSRSRARWCETSGWLWSSGPVISQTQRSPPSRNSRICARTGLQNALKNGTKSVMLPTSERSSLAFMPPPRDALQRNGLARCTQHNTLTNAYGQVSLYKEIHMTEHADVVIACHEPDATVLESGTVGSRMSQQTIEKASRVTDEMPQAGPGIPACAVSYTHLRAHETRHDLV